MLLHFFGPPAIPALIAQLQLVNSFVDSTPALCESRDDIGENDVVL